MDILYLMWLMLLLPPICAIISLARVTGTKTLGLLAQLTSVAVLIIWFVLCGYVQEVGKISRGIFYLDALGIWFLLTLAVVYLLISLVSNTYLQREAGDYNKNSHYEHYYFALVHFFVAIMMVVFCIDNLGIMWVCVEATTLVSALLVAFRFTKSSIEAAWKYVMVCTVGICFALLGTIILYYAQTGAVDGLATADALDTGWLLRNAGMLDVGLVKYAFLFIFIGYGTKMGLAPMHTWLPDTYAQAPSTISALLSGGLTTCVTFVLIKNLMVVRQALEAEFITNMLLFFGVLSIGVALPFMFVQREMKRLFAYSSVENIGLVTIALAINSEVAAIGLLIFVLNHAIIKFVLFYLAGRLIFDFGSDNMMRIHGLLIATPRLARTLLFAAMAIVGMPPFGIFFGKLYILRAVFAKGHVGIGILVLLMLVGIFLGFFYHIIRMLSDRQTKHVEPFDRFDSVVMIGALVVSALAGVLFAYGEDSLLMQATYILSSGVIQ